jgi:predicted enzyme related to lactoylglutathione lyase
MNNPIGWVEIPVTDMARAIEFYNYIFGYDLQVMNLQNLEMAFLPWHEDGKGTSGALVKNVESYEPSALAGVVIYFTCADIVAALSRATEKGGQVIRAKTEISPEHGFMALIKDSEGNRIALHSRS